MPLEPYLVGKAMQEELKLYDQLEVYEETLDSVCRSEIGGPPTSCRWRVINNGDDYSVDMRARLLVRRIKRKGWTSIFAATPPRWAFRYLCSSAVSTKRLQGRVRKILILDLVRAYFHAVADGKTFVKPPHFSRNRQVVAIVEVHVWNFTSRCRISRNSQCIQQK